MEGLREWMHTQTGFGHQHSTSQQPIEAISPKSKRNFLGTSQVGETAPLGFYTPRESLTGEAPGGSISMGLGLRSEFKLMEYHFREEASVTPEEVGGQYVPAHNVLGEPTGTSG